jgi:hypothetical protein
MTAFRLVPFLALAACGAPSPDQARLSVNAIQEVACLSAVRNASMNPEVTLLSAAPAPGAAAITFGVGPDNAPWICTVAEDGTVQGVAVVG